MARYEITDRNGELLAIINADSASEAVREALKLYPTSASAEEKNEPVDRNPK